MSALGIRASVSNKRGDVAVFPNSTLMAPDLFRDAQVKPCKCNSPPSDAEAFFARL